MSIYTLTIFSVGYQT